VPFFAFCTTYNGAAQDFRPLSRSMHSSCLQSTEPCKFSRCDLARITAHVHSSTFIRTVRYCRSPGPTLITSTNGVRRPCSCLASYQGPRHISKKQKPWLGRNSTKSAKEKSQDMDNKWMQDNYTSFSASESTVWEESRYTETIEKSYRQWLLMNIRVLLFIPCVRTFRHFPVQWF
jgi:hypothetical protein